MNFAQAVHFVRWKLDHCTDNQLAGAGLSTRERDNFLERDVLLSASLEEDGYSALFWPRPSLKANATVIEYKPGQNSIDMIDTAGHEAFHAAKLWGSPDWQRQLKSINTARLGQFGVVTVLSTALQLGLGYSMHLQSTVAAAGIQLGIGLGMMIGGYHLLPNSNDDLHHEEMGAHRFGYLFNADVYSTKCDFSCDKDSLLDKSYWQRIATGAYPTAEKRYDLLMQTKQECLERTLEDPLFPDGLKDFWFEYGESQKSFDRSDIGVYVPNKTYHPRNAA